MDEKTRELVRGLSARGGEVLTEDEVIFLLALEITAEAWLNTVDIGELFTTGSPEAASLANVLQRWLATRGKGPLVR